MSWLWAALAALAASTGALIASGLILALGRRAQAAAGWALAFAVGTLLAAATLLLLPESLEVGGGGRVLPRFLAGLLLFIAVERLLRWRHPHRPEHHPHHLVDRSTAVLLLWSDGLHNFIDGLVLGAAFEAGTEVGAATALAVLAHELPQEIGDFAVLLDAGLGRLRALALNYASALAVLPGSLVSSWASGHLEAAAGWLLPIAAGGFTYIALADLVPALQHRRGGWAALAQLALIGTGVALVWLIGRLGHGH